MKGRGGKRWVLGCIHGGRQGPRWDVRKDSRVPVVQNHVSDIPPSTQWTFLMHSLLPPSLPSSPPPFFPLPGFVSGHRLQRSLYRCMCGLTPSLSHETNARIKLMAEWGDSVPVVRLDKPDSYD